MERARRAEKVQRRRADAQHVGRDAALLSPVGHANLGVRREGPDGGGRRVQHEQNTAGGRGGRRVAAERELQPAGAGDRLEFSWS